VCRHDRRQYSQDYVPLEAAAAAGRKGIWAGQFQVPRCAAPPALTPRPKLTAQTSMASPSTSSPQLPTAPLPQPHQLRRPRHTQTQAPTQTPAHAASGASRTSAGRAAP
jgi:hypothetical protein